MVKRLAFLFLIAAAGCPKPDRNGPPPAVASVTIGGSRVVVEWLRSDPDRRSPIGEREALAGDRGILCGWARDRILHFFSRSSAAFDAAFLSAEGKILETQSLPAYSEAGITSKVEARYALFLPEGWLARHGAGAGARAVFSPEIERAPADPMPQVKVGDATVNVETAHLYSERVRGLMHRRTMSADDGMLFIYPEAEGHKFWMGNCHYALDIAFFGADRKLLNVVSIDPYADPAVDTGERAESAGPAQFVLEVHRGWFAKKGLADEAGRPIGKIGLGLPASLEVLVGLAE